MVKFIICVTVFAVVALAAAVQSVFISNLNAACMLCLCEGATGCNKTASCKKGFCGPFYISRAYWLDADKYVLPDDDPERADAYADCANEYTCANNIVENYMLKYGNDCNGDGVTNCDDYSMIHLNGGFNCAASIEGTKFHERYTRCRSPEETEEEVAEAAATA